MDQLSVAEEFANGIKEAGLEPVAENLGIMKDGKIPALEEFAKVPATGLAQIRNREKRPAEIAMRTSTERDVASRLVSATGLGAKRRRWDQSESASGADHDAGEPIQRPIQNLSLRVIRVLEAKKTPTTAGELQSEIIDALAKASGPLCEPELESRTEEIRRRVKDTVNVLVAMDLIERDDRGSLTWRGLPANAPRDLSMMQRERATLMESIKAKSKHLQELLLQSVSLKNLAERNKARGEDVPEDQRIPLPFIVVSTSKDTVIECEMAENQTDIFFNFNRPFEIHDDSDILRRMHLQKASRKFLETFLPRELLPFVPAEVLSDGAKSSGP